MYLKCICIYGLDNVNNVCSFIMNIYLVWLALGTHASMGALEQSSDLIGQ